MASTRRGSATSPRARTVGRGRLRREHRARARRLRAAWLALLVILSHFHHGSPSGPRPPVAASRQSFGSYPRVHPRGPHSRDCHGLMQRHSSAAAPRPDLGRLHSSPASRTVYGAAGRRMGSGASTHLRASSLARAGPVVISDLVAPVWSSSQASGVDMTRRGMACSGTGGPLLPALPPGGPSLAVLATQRTRGALARCGLWCIYWRLARRVRPRAIGKGAHGIGYPCGKTHRSHQRRIAHGAFFFDRPVHGPRRLAHFALLLCAPRHRRTSHLLSGHTHSADE